MIAYNYFLVRIQSKSIIRDFLKKLANSSPSKIKHSSLYRVGNEDFMVICLELSLFKELINREKDIIVVDANFIANSLVYQILFSWGSSEIAKTVAYLELENQSKLGDNGRILTINGVTITRTYDFLADILVILNYTADSFSDGGLYNTVEVALMRIIEQVTLGATVVDVGVESTRPNATKLSANCELYLLKQIIYEVIKLKQNYNFKISVDTYHQETALFLNNLAVDFINDVSGAMPYDVVKSVIANGKKYIAMHNLGIPANRTHCLDRNCDVVEYVYAWMQAKLEALLSQQINATDIILDVGIGFGKSSAQSLALLRNISKFAKLPCALLVGHSRKSFLKHVRDFDVTKQDVASAVVSLFILPHVDYLRIHDLKQLRTIYPFYAELSDY